jgi:hypothetical protein
MKGKGELALDMIVKFLIVLVVAGLVIGLFLRFSSDSKDAVKDMFTGKNNTSSGFPKTFQKASFSPGEVAQSIESCYNTMTSLAENSQKDMTCYVLMADSPFSGFVTSGNILGAVDSKIRGRVRITTAFDKDYVKVSFYEFIKDTSTGNLISNVVVVS